MSECSRYMISDTALDEWEPCHCPICGGFLKQDFPLDTIFKCNKCGTELLCMPDPVESEGEFQEEGNVGRICPISKPSQQTLKGNVKNT